MRLRLMNAFYYIPTVESIVDITPLEKDKVCSDFVCDPELPFSPIVVPSVDKSDPAVYDEAQRYIEEKYLERKNEIFYILSSFMYLIRNKDYEIVAINDGAGPCYSVCQAKNIVCHSYDKKKKMCNAAKELGNDVVYTETYDFAKWKDKLIFVSHSEEVDPGNVMEALSAGCQVIVFESHPFFLGSTLLYRNNYAVFSTFNFKFPLSNYKLKVPRTHGSWYKLFDQGRVFMINDPSCVSCFRFAEYYSLAYSVCSYNPVVYELLKLNSYCKLVAPTYESITIYRKRIDSVTRRYFSLREGRFHDGVFSYDEYNNRVYTIHFPSSRFIQYFDRKIYIHTARIVGVTGDEFNSLRGDSGPFETYFYKARSEPCLRGSSMLPWDNLLDSKLPIFRKFLRFYQEYPSILLKLPDIIETFESTLF
jgi:hypothetical protein